MSGRRSIAEIATEMNTLDETPCGEGIGWWHDPSLPVGVEVRRERTDITCADHGCEICAPHRAQRGRKTISEIADVWAADPGEWAADAARILRAVRVGASNDGGILDAAYSTLSESGYTDEEIDEGDLCEALAEAFLGRLIAAGGAS